VEKLPPGRGVTNESRAFETPIISDVIIGIGAEFFIGRQRYLLGAELLLKSVFE